MTIDWKAAREALPAIPPGTVVGKPVADEAEHFFNCVSCGQAVDMRDLGEVFRHEEPDHEARVAQ
jgi:hypothetical protein